MESKENHTNQIQPNQLAVSRIEILNLTVSLISTNRDNEDQLQRQICGLYKTKVESLLNSDTINEFARYKTLLNFLAEQYHDLLGQTHTNLQAQFQNFQTHRFKNTDLPEVSTENNDLIDEAQNVIDTFQKRADLLSNLKTEVIRLNNIERSRFSTLNNDLCNTIRVMTYEDLKRENIDKIVRLITENPQSYCTEHYALLEIALRHSSLVNFKKTFLTFRLFESNLNLMIETLSGLIVPRDENRFPKRLNSLNLELMEIKTNIKILQNTTGANFLPYVKRLENTINKYHSKLQYEEDLLDCAWQLLCIVSVYMQWSIFWISSEEKNKKLEELKPNDLKIFEQSNIYNTFFKAASKNDKNEDVGLEEAIKTMQRTTYLSTLI